MTSRPPIRSFRDLEVWRLSRVLVRDVHLACSAFPERGARGLADQLRRAAVSVPANIAEGFARRGGAYRYHVNVARGSLAELDTHLQLALDHLALGPFLTLSAQVEHVGRMLTALDRALASHGERARGRA